MSDVPRVIRNASPAAILAGGVPVHALDADDAGKLAWVTDMMRDLSTKATPQELVGLYSERMRQLQRADAFVTLSRRDLNPPTYRITRSTRWDEELDPWTQADRLPTMEGGLLGELLYAGEAVAIGELSVGADDPAAEYFEGMRSLMAIPLFDAGEGMNMVVQMKADPDAYPPADLPGQVWMSNLFGRATHNLVLKQQLEETQKALNREIREIARMQRSLVTVQTDLPQDRGLELAEFWSPSQQAGGDFFNAWPLSHGRTGLMIADVSGHGVAAAVMTAVCHAIVHTSATPDGPPDRVLTYLNENLCDRYTRATSQFVTGVYASYDPATRTLTYSSAGHPPPFVVSGCGGDCYPLDGGRGLPLGIEREAEYEVATARLGLGDVLVFFTDGITEARDPHGQLFGIPRLQDTLDGCAPDATEIIAKINAAVDAFSKGLPADDDRTILVARVDR